jgi:hypothetical protein
VTKKKCAKKKQAKKQVVHKKKKTMDKEIAGFYFSNPKEK